MNRNARMVLVNVFCNVTARNSVRRYAKKANVRWNAMGKNVNKNAGMVLVNVVCNVTAKSSVSRYAKKANVRWNATNHTVSRIATAIHTNACFSVKMKLTRTSAHRYVTPMDKCVPLSIAR